MKSDELKVTVEEGSFFAKMFIEQKLKTSSYLKDVYNTIELATRLNCISESRIEDVHIEKTKEDEAKITIEYRKVSVSDLTESEDMKDKIIGVLKYLEYSEADIKSVSFYQKYVNSEAAWYVEIWNSYDPDETMSQHSEEIGMSKLLSKIFKQPVHFSIG